MLKTSIVCFLASYGCAFAFELVRLKWRPAFGRLLAFVIALAGLIAETFYLLNRSSQLNLPPLLSSAHDWLLVLAWLVVLAYLFVTLVDRELSIGLVVWPVVLALVISSRFVTDSPSHFLDHHQGWKMLHASTLVMGTAGVLLGFILSLLYLWQHYRLKHGQILNRSVKLPNLERTERLNRWAILLAVPCLTFGVASGVWLSVIATKESLSLNWTDPVVIGGAVTWTLMGILFIWLITHRRTPGRQIALLTVWSCGFLLVTLVGLQVLTAAMGMPSIHGTAEVRPGASR